MEIVQGVLLASKRPHRSVSNILRHSTRVQATYADVQVNTAAAVVQIRSLHPTASARAPTYGMACGVG